MLRVYGEEQRRYKGRAECEALLFIFSYVVNKAKADNSDKRGINRVKDSYL